MNSREALWLAHQRRRWMLPDPSRFLRPDHVKWVRPEAAWHPAPQLYECKYSAEQPRVPAGNAEGGQWMSGGSSSGAGRNDPRVLSDVTPDNDWKPGAQYAQNRGGRGSAPVRIGGQTVEVTPGQAARLQAAGNRAEDALRQVRQVDPNWRPGPSVYGTGVESEIQKANDLAVAAQARVDELARAGIGPGPFAGDSIPARGPERDFNVLERLQNRKNFSATGCHTCGTSKAGTMYGDPILDHQPPTGLNYNGAAQRLYPQCLTCSLRQGNWIMRYKRVER
jgi:hypothetical protein